jgi:hypothetical protein
MCNFRKWSLALLIPVKSGLCKLRRVIRSMDRISFARLLRLRRDDGMLEAVVGSGGSAASRWPMDGWLGGRCDVSIALIRDARR